MGSVNGELRAGGRRALGRLFGVAVLVCGCSSGPGWGEAGFDPVGERAKRVASHRLEGRASAIPAESSKAVRSEPAFERQRGGGDRFSFWDWDGRLVLADFGQQGVEEKSAAKVAEGRTSSAIERGPLGRFFETVERDLKLLPRSFWEDTKAVYTDPLNMIVLLSAGGASLALRPEVDDDIEDGLRGKDIFSDDWNDAFGALGNPGTHFAMAGVWYLLGQQMQDTKTYEVGRTLFNALAINGASTMVLKVASWTDAPNGEWGGWPSGHVSSTVTMAAVLEEAYGPLVGIPLYGLAALVAVERLDDEEHHFSDVVFGAVLGYVVGKTVAKGHRPQIFGGEIVPYADPVGGSSGLAWVKTFP